FSAADGGGGGGGMLTAGFGAAGLGGDCGVGVAALPRGIESAAVKSRSDTGSSDLPAGLAAAAPGLLPAAGVPADTSRTKPALSSSPTSFSNAASNVLPTFCA